MKSIVRSVNGKMDKEIEYYPTIKRTEFQRFGVSSLCAKIFFLHGCICVTRMPMPVKKEVLNWKCRCCETLYGFREQNLGSLQEHLVFLITEPFL